MFHLDCRSRFVSINLVSFRLDYSVLIDSLHLISSQFIRFVSFHSFDNSFVRSCSILIRFDKSTRYPMVDPVNWFCSSIVVHLLYIRFWIYKTTQVAILREQLLRRNIHPKLFCKLTVTLCCVLLFCWFTLILNSNLDLSGRGANRRIDTRSFFDWRTHDVASQSCQYVLLTTASTLMAFVPNADIAFW